MANDLERGLNRSPASSSSVSHEPIPVLYQGIPFNDGLLQILTTDSQLKFMITVQNQLDGEIGILKTERLVCNSRNLRLLSIESSTDLPAVKDLLRRTLIEIAKGKGWNIFLSERIDEPTKQWLIENKLDEFPKDF